MIESPNGKAILTLKKESATILAIIALIQGTTIPTLIAADIPVPKWVAIVVGTIGSIISIIGFMSGGARKKRAAVNPPGVVAVNVPAEVVPEVKP